ncbi:hypothetical protein M408DRAFT_28662, partial [Serendipita vermifera MAFF 305830]
RRGNRRKHYRIVFKGKAGQALHDISSPREYFTGLLGGVKALRALRKAGYIHRDLSTGNVLLVKGDQGKADHGVLIDLEYAKRFPDTGEESHNVRTGTFEFMACEVDARDFLFLPDTSDDTVVPWFHNPIHDIESIWWIAVWDYRHVNATMRSLFRDLAGRSNFVHSPSFFLRKCPEIPTNVRHSLHAWLVSIRSQYTELESLVPKQSHRTFDYNSVFEAAIRFIEAILKEQAFTFPAEAERPAGFTDGLPPKRQKVQKQDDEDSS